MDHAATTPLSERALAATVAMLRLDFGNPSSVHRIGQSSRRALEEAREVVASSVGAEPRGVIFTSGATEADNMAVFGALQSRQGGLVVSATEHPAVLTAAKRVAASGRSVSFVRPQSDGSIALSDIEVALDEQAASGGTALVAVMHVNNETGVISEPAPIAELAHARGALFLCDAVQALGTEVVSMTASGADFLTISAHKVYGPKGAGALIISRGTEVPPLLAGGEQERGYRPGTHNLPAIVGMAVAVQDAVADRAAERARLAELQQRFENGAKELGGVRVNGAGAPRSVKNSSLAIEGVDGETVLMLLDAEGIMVSAGSACSAGSLDPSHVLLAMGLSRAQAKASVRFSFGKLVDEGSIDVALNKLGSILDRVRAYAK